MIIYYKLILIYYKLIIYYKLTDSHSICSMYTYI